MHSAHSSVRSGMCSPLRASLSLSAATVSPGGRRIQVGGAAASSSGAGDSAAAGGEESFGLFWAFRLHDDFIERVLVSLFLILTLLN